MKALKISMLSLMFISLSMLGLTAVATTPDGETPPNEGVCNDLVGTTPGLYGLCVAFCEAQDCEATYDPATDALTFDESCRPSSPKLLANFNKRAGVGGPHMPCVNITENECPCWTEAELDVPLTNDGTRCTADDSTFAQFFIVTPTGGLTAVARTNPTTKEELGCLYEGVDLINNVARVSRIEVITQDENATCVASIAAECISRGF